MYDEVIDLLKAHEYFRGVSDTIVGKSPALGRSLITTLLRSSTSLTIPSAQSALYSGVG
jgi:hypothetical protein